VITAYSVRLATKKARVKLPLRTIT